MPQGMARADLEGEAAQRCAGGGIAPADVRPSPAAWRQRPLSRIAVRALLGALVAAGAIIGTALVPGRWIAPPPAAAASAVLPRALSEGGRAASRAAPSFSPSASRAATP